MKGCHSLLGGSCLLLNWRLEAGAGVMCSNTTPCRVPGFCRSPQIQPLSREIFILETTSLNKKKQGRRQTCVFRSHSLNEESEQAGSPLGVLHAASNAGLLGHSPSTPQEGDDSTWKADFYSFRIIEYRVIAHRKLKGTHKHH